MAFLAPVAYVAAPLALAGASHLATKFGKEKLNKDVLKGLKIFTKVALVGAAVVAAGLTVHAFAPAVTGKVLAVAGSVASVAFSVLSKACGFALNAAVYVKDFVVAHKGKLAIGAAIGVGAYFLSQRGKGDGAAPAAAANKEAAAAPAAPVVVLN